MGYVPPTPPRPYLLGEDKTDVDSNRRYLGDDIDVRIETRFDRDQPEWPPAQFEGATSLLPILGCFIVAVGLIAAVMLVLGVHP